MDEIETDVSISILRLDILYLCTVCTFCLWETENTEENTGDGKWRWVRHPAWFGVYRCDRTFRADCCGGVPPFDKGWPLSYEEVDRWSVRP